jgi:hypothetical protein
MHGNFWNKRPELPSAWDARNHFDFRILIFFYCEFWIHSLLSLLSHAGNWLFSSRRWLDPLKPRDRAQLEGNFEALCDAFQPFAAHCELANYLQTLLDISTAWARISETGFNDLYGCRRSLADDGGIHRTLGLPQGLLEPSSRDPVASAAAAFDSEATYALHGHSDAQASHGPGPTQPVLKWRTAVKRKAARSGATLPAAREWGAADFKLWPIPPDLGACGGGRGGGRGAAADRPWHEALQQDGGCGLLSSRLFDGPDRQGRDQNRKMPNSLPNSA